MKFMLPYKPYGAFSGKAHLLYAPGLRLVDFLGFWRYPANIDQNFRHNILHRYVRILYRRYKSTKPILKPEKGSELGAYFAAMRQPIGRPLLPAGFNGEKSVSISAVGDLMGVKGLEHSKDKFYAKISELIFEADLSIANLESPLARAKIDFRKQNTTKKFRYLTPQPNHITTLDSFDAIKGHKDKRYTIFCTANNHMLDDGMRGFKTTHDQLEAEGFHYVGTNRSPEDQKRGLIVSSNGIKIGLVAATYRMNNRGLGHYPEDMDEYLVNVVPFHSFRGKVDLSLLEDQISDCKTQNCDFIIVILHWGMEFEFFPRQDQVDIAHHVVEFGADAIISHHAHNIQPYELYQTRRDPQRFAPIFYGLGNLTSFWSAPSYALSLIANIKVVKGRINGISKTLIVQNKVYPVLQLEYDSNEKQYLQIDKLCDLIQSASSGSNHAYYNEAGRYADLVLGTVWRK